MSFTIPELIDQLQPPATLVKTEPLAVIKSERSEPEIHINDILDPPEDIKNIDIVLHLISEDLIKTEAVPENLLEPKHSGSAETQTEYARFVKRENITQSESLNKTEDTSTGQEVVEGQGSHNDFYTLNNLETNEPPEKIELAEGHRICKTTSWEEIKEKIKIIEAPVIPVKQHEYTSLAKHKHICNYCQCTTNRLSHLKTHIAKLHRIVGTMYQCPYCPFKSKWKMSLQNHIILKHKDITEIQSFKCHICKMKFKLSRQLAKHKLTHLTHEQMQDKLKFCLVCGKGFRTQSNVREHVKFVHNKEPVKYHCDKCSYKTYARQNLYMHKTVHLKPEEIQYFYCLHCSYKSKQKGNLKYHIFRHFKKREIEHVSKCNETKYNFKLQELSHQTKKKLDDQYLKYHCDKCNYKTYLRPNLNRHKLTHLKPEEIQYFYCYHCSVKYKHKEKLKSHILKHFKNGEVAFHCYICDFMTLNRESITKHIEEHSKVQIKLEIKEES